jgi:hypothetical protein
VELAAAAATSCDVDSALINLSRKILVEFSGVVFARRNQFARISNHFGGVRLFDNFKVSGTRSPACLT